MDLITLAMAKSYTDEKVAEGGGSAVIDLAKFFVAENVSINLAILSQFQAGGGQFDFADTIGFWNAVDTDRNLKFVIDGSIMDAIVIADVTSRVTDAAGNLASIEISFLIGLEVWTRVTIIFAHMHYLENGNDTRVAVVLEQLTVPGV